MSEIREDGSEVFHYDDPEFPVFCRNNWIPAGYELSRYTPMHYHEEVEFVYIVEGKAHHRINGDYVTLPKGTGLFINSRQFHELIADKNEDCTLYCLIFNPMMLASSIKLERMIELLSEDENLEYVVLDENTEWKNSVLQLIKETCELNKSEGNQLAIVSRLYTIWEILFGELEHHERDGKRINSNQRLIKNMIMFIQKNYQNDVNLEDISDSGNVGKTKCTALFKKYTSMTPIDYLRCYRLERSFELLTMTDMSVSDIAYEVGFSGASYYSELFKQKVGITPLKYRKVHKENNE